MKSVKVVSMFRENQFDLVKAGVLPAKLVYFKAGMASNYGKLAMNMRPSEAEEDGYDVRLSVAKLGLFNWAGKNYGTNNFFILSLCFRSLFESAIRFHVG